MEKDQQVLELLHDGNFKECRTKIISDNKYMVYVTSIKNGKFSDKNILKAIHEHPYQNIILSVENSNIVTMKQEKKFII
jgi:hypothetical protein